jgi:type IV secretion system protein VirB10
MDGTVNRHTWERLEGAAYLLLGQGAIQAAQTALQASLQHGSGNSYVNLNTGSVQSVVAELLRGSFNIPNTVEKNQGEEIGILITQPIDFSDAYRLRRP